jgi:hypothetical protein
MLTVCCFKWRPVGPYRSTFGPDTVNTLAGMVRRHYADPHRFLCITDDAEGLDSSIDVLPIWRHLADVPNPMGVRRPSCYRRLTLFDPAMAPIVGKRVVWLDLDCVVTNDLRPLWNRPEDVVLWGGTHQKTPYNGSMVLLTVGARPKVWARFHPVLSPRQTRAAGFYGSDQAWLSYVLGPKEARWTQADGVYSFPCDVEPRGLLPPASRIVFFHGPAKLGRPTISACRRPLGRTCRG